MKIVYKIVMISSLLITSCGGSDDSSPEVTPTPEAEVLDPKATTLIFPDDNTECNEGVIIDDTTSRVTFRWNLSADTDRYDLNIRNITTNVSSLTISDTGEADVTIDRGTPYEWFVVSRATGTAVTASSPTFKFYNQGPGIENYAPFPAEVVSPKRGSSVTDSGGTVILEWQGTDVDDDIVSYEVLFGTNVIPTDSLGSTSELTFDVTVTTTDTIYFWRVISTDSQGNTSKSEVFDFIVTS